jgi:hypothetical protein
MPRVVPAYDQNRLPFGTTLARQIARQHLRNLNNVYWVAERSRHLIRGSFDQIRMPMPGPGVHGCFDGVATWQSAVDEFRVWTRQYTLVSAASLLEVYVRSAAIATFWASPELVDRSQSNVDSVSLIKFPDRVPSHLKKLIDDRSEGFTKGSWTDRLHSLTLNLGVIPASLQTLSTELQQVQDLRNKIAHSYGLNGELRRTPWQKINAINVTPARIVSTTKAISSFTRIADSDVFGPHIGGYEMIHEFHAWCRSNRNIGRLRVAGGLDSAFRDHIGKAFGRTPGADYVRAMIAYYDGIR